MATKIVSPDSHLSSENAQLSEAALLEAKEILAADAALEAARAHLCAMTEAASAADAMIDDSAPTYSLHEVAGIGRYVIVRHTGWRPLIKVIHDPAANIDFSANLYPCFDGIIGKNFASPYLLDPLDDHFASYESLRDNIAAVRNFLMETYYASTPEGMTPQKAEKALEEIARYVGEGLDNNYRFLGIIPNFKPNKPHISIAEASMPGGAGAQYLYEKILQMHRQSSWLRPFSAVVTLFGGKAIPDWMLPPAYKTEFTNFFEHDILHKEGHGPSEADLRTGIAEVESLEASRAALLERHHTVTTAGDLDAMGNFLIYSASNMQQVGQLSEPVRRDAIDIAKEILRKLKVNLGGLNLKDGLGLSPSDDVAALGGVKGVAMVYEKLLAYGRGVDPTIMQHPAVLSATRAIGQLGYLAKLEALRMARIAGDGTLAESLSSQLARIPEVYAITSEATFGGLIDKVERGIDFLRSRAQTINGPGAHVGFSTSQDLGSINAPPTAGMSQQLSNTQASSASRGSQALAAQRAHDEHLERNDVKGNQLAQQISRTGVARSASQQAARNAQRNANSTSSNTSSLNPLQRLQQMRANMLSHHDDDEHDHFLRQQQLLMVQRQAAQRVARNAQRVAKVTSSHKGDVHKVHLDPHLLESIHHATDTHGLVGDPINPGSKKSHTQSIQSKHDPKNQHTLGDHSTEDDKTHPPTMPPHKPGGRGF